MTATGTSDAFDALAARLGAAFPGLGRQARKAARALLDRPDAVATQSMRAIAEREGLPPATFVRLARGMGFAGWAELRQVFVGRLLAGAGPYSGKAAAVQAAALPMAGGVLAAVGANLAAAAGEAAAIEAAADLLSEAPAVHLAGFRSCHALTAGFAYLIRLLRDGVVLMAAPGAMLEQELLAIRPGAAVLVVSFAPYSREAVVTAEAAIARGARLLALSDSALAPVQQGAAVALRFRTDTPSFFPSLAAAQAMLEAVAATMLARGGEEMLARLRANEAELARLGAYLPRLPEGGRPAR
ncbi:MAG: MurR/RpiR family transcriptional regulator [Thalassobaculales bacterium]